MERLRYIREQAGYSQQDLADESGVSQHTISEIELGRRKPQGRTLRKLAKVLGIEVADLYGGSEHPLAKAPPSPTQLPLNGFEEERSARRRPVWEAAAEEARRLREDGRARMDELLTAWRASRERGEPRAGRREYMDGMGNLLEEAYAADIALGEAYIEAAIIEGGSEAEVPSYLREESRMTSDFYVELFGLVQSAGLSVRRGKDAAAAKRAAKVQSGRRPHSVEEPEAA